MAHIWKTIHENQITFGMDDGKTCPTLMPSHYLYNTVEPLIFASLLFSRISRGGANSRKLKDTKLKVYT
jgi:hypothetical protein